MNFGKFLNISCILLLSYMWVFAGVNVFSLPDTIPLHFGLDGKPDNYGTKWMVFLMPFIATVLFVLMRYLSKSKEVKWDLTIKEKMRNNRNLSRLFVRIIAVFVLLLFSDLLTESILIAQGKYKTISQFSTLVIIGMFASILVFFLYARKKVHEID